tara:strand:+ start:2241 stop:2672 length:432 start_codon:yes stop_codon:yes gene_type:complete
MNNYVQVIVGLVVFYVGLKMFASGMKSMAVPEHLNYWLGSPLWMFIGGVVMTMLWQSSSLSTTAIVALVASGALPLPAAIGAILGANVGTCTTIFLASAFLDNGWPRGDNLRISIVHVSSNLLMAAMLLPFANQIARLIGRVG